MNARKVYVAAVVLAALLAYDGPSHASGNFRLRSLRGVYGFSGSGTLFGGAVQAAIVALNSFDGAGGCDIKAPFECRRDSLFADHSNVYLHGEFERHRLNNRNVQ